MANPNDNLYRLYQNGLKHFSLPDFDTFKSDMMDEEKRRRFYTNMQEAYSLPDFNTFSTDIGAVTPPPAKPAQTTQTTQQPAATQTVKPVTDTTADTARVQPTVTTLSQPEQPTGWQPSWQQRMAVDMMVQRGQERLQKQMEDFEKTLQGIQKGNRPNAFMGEREFNPQTGQMETHYYTTQGEQVPTRMEQIRRNTEYHTWWENNTDAGRRSKEQRLQREFEGRLGSLWSRHDPAEGENAAAQALTAAGIRQQADAEAIAADVYRDRGNAMANAAFLGGPENHVMNASMNRHRQMVAHLKNYDLDRLMEDSWNNLGEKGQQALIDDCHQMLRYRNPGADDLVLYQQAKELARQQSNLRLYNLAVERNMPKDNLEYLMRKIGDANLLNSVSKGLAVSAAGTTGDMAALEDANEQYRQDGHKVVDVVGTVTGMALDPTMWISGGVGSMATKGALWAGGRYIAGRGATAAVTNAAARQFGTSLTGRIVAGVAGGAANFGTYEGLKEIESQYEHGGHIVGQDESGRYINEGYSAGAVGKQALHGLGMGAAIGWLTPVSGNVADRLVMNTSSTIGKMATRTGLYAGATTLEGTIFSVPEWISGERDAMDVWTDNMAMMVGFKTTHMLKSAGGVLGDLHKSLESPTNGRKNRLDFESRLRMRMDAPSDGGLALTNDEKAELERHGYGDLRELVKSAERTGNAAEGGLIAENAPEMVSRLTDIVTDSRVSEAARAKMYYYATGRKLPESTIMRGEMIEDGNGGFIVESQGANGVITSRSFTSRKAADLELERINRQVELNHIEIGERYQQTMDFENRLQGACRTVAEENGWDPVTVYKVCEEARRNHLRKGDKQFDEAQQAILRKVIEEMGEFEEAGVTDAMRGRINEKYGVDIDKAIRKDANRRTQAEQTAIDEYLDELIPDKAKDHPFEDVDAEDITNQKLLTDNGGEPELPKDEPIDPRFDESDRPQDIDPHQPNNGEQRPIGRATMKFEDRPVEVLSGRVVMMEDGTMVDNERSDNSVIIRDIATGKVEMVSPEAILTYEDYPVETPIDEAPAEQPAEMPAEEGEPQPKYTSGQITIRNSDGTTSRGILTGEVVTEENYEDLGLSHNDIGKHEYYVEGNLKQLYYATEHELDNILDDYKPDAPAEGNGAENIPTEGNIEGENIPAPDAKEYENGYTQGIQQAEQWSDEQLQAEYNKLAENLASATDFGKGWIAALEHELQRRQAEAQPQQADGGSTLPQGITPVGNIAVPQRDGSARTFTVGKNAEGETVLLDESGFMWGHDGNGGEMRPYRPGESVPTWTDEQIAALTPQQTETPAPVEGVPTPTESVPESVPTPTENPVLEGESVPKTDVSVENGQQTALQRLPKDAEGEPIFEQAENPEHGWDAAVEYYEGDTAAAKEMVDLMASEKKKALEKAQKAKAKGKTPKEIKASQKANAANLAQAQSEFDLWDKMSRVEQNRQAAIRSQQEAEARQRAMERAEAEKAEREAQEEAARIQREALEGIPEWHLDTPENARKRGVRRFSGEVFTRQEPVDGVAGKEIEVKFSQEDLPKGKVAVIEASQLQPSHIQGRRNPMFFIEEAQPKNRSEAVSSHAARQIAEGIRPEEITGSATAYTGAPTVNTRGEVIQGNNRSDALRYLWENNLPQQQATYKQYLIDNAETLGLDPEAVSAMQQPVLVNMLDVDDAEAIRLGQMTAQDTESGGIERIKPKNVAQKLGDDMRTFANMLLHSGDEEATFGQLVDSNGTEVLKWMNQVGAITSTQYQSAFDSKGNLTAEAKNDLQKVLYQAIFKGGSQQLEEMFDKLPAKAQRALLATAFRDMDSPFAGKLLPEIQSSIAAYNLLMGDPTFAAAKNMEGALRAVEAFKATIALDDRFEQYMPADNFSNFALHLAAMYKAGDMSQTTIAGYFNQMYDLAQGKKEATLFEEADTTKYPLAEVINKVLNIEYQPAKNGNNYERDGGADVALRNQDGQGGELRGNEPPAGGEQNPRGAEPTERGAGTPDDSRGAGEVETSDSEDDDWLDEEPIEEQIAHAEKMLDRAILHKNAIDQARQRILNDTEGKAAYDETMARLEAEEGGRTPLWYDSDEKTAFENVWKSDLTVSFLTRSQDLTNFDMKREGALMATWDFYVKQSTNNSAEALIKTTTKQVNDIRKKLPTSTQAAVEAASSEVDQNPTEAQKEAGNYKKGHVTIGDFDITIENPAGSVRSGVDANGKKWETKMANAYGYIKGTQSVDGDHIDVFLHENMDEWDGRKVYVVDQTKPDGTFDEHKVMLGFNDGYDAWQAYLANYDATWQDKHPGLRISETNIEDFKKWIDSSHRKTKPFADYANVKKETTEAENTNSAENLSQKSAENLRGDGYNIVSKPYTNKNGKTLDTYLVKFDRDFSKEELSAMRAKAKEMKGWRDKESGGWMLRSAEDAKAFAEDVMGKSAEEMEDEAPLSLTDLDKDLDKPVSKSDKPTPKSQKPAVKKVDVPGVATDLQTKGEAKLSDHTTPVEQPKPKKRSKWISEEDADEFRSLRDGLRNHLGADDDVAHEDASGYGKPQPKQMDAEVLRMGTRMTYLMMKGGLRKFSDYAEAMVEEVGDAIRPHLKSLYAAAQNMEEVMELGWDEEMDDRKTVKAFDVYNFDKPGAKDIVETAKGVVDERESQAQMEKIVELLKGKRNEQRKQEADKTSADTEAIAGKAEATASKVESELQDAKSEEDADRLNTEIDKQIDEVNKQLALLGYYEADPIEKDFNEAYGYMRNAERKATEDAHRLATQLAADLGVTLPAKDKVKKDKRHGFGSSVARSNIAPAGGEVRITLPLTEQHKLSMTFHLEPNATWLANGRVDRPADDLVYTGGYFYIEGPGNLGSNRRISAEATYDELLSDVRSVTRHLLPSEQMKPTEPLTPQPGEDLVGMAERVTKDRKPKAPAVKPEQSMGDLFGGLFDEEPTKAEPPTPAPAKPEAPKAESKPKAEPAKPDSKPTKGVPVISQWQAMKDKHPEAIVLMRVGDFYETFKDDAMAISEILGLTLTRRASGTKDQIELAGFQHSKLDEYLPKLVRSGRRVALCEQLSQTPKKSTTNTPKNNEKTDVQPRTETTGRGGQQPRPNEQMGASAGHEAERTDGRGVDRRNPEHPVSDTERSGGVSVSHQSERSVESSRTPSAPKNTRNNHAERGVDYAPKGEKARIDANIAAIELAKKLLESGATATPQEMAILRKYSGWGGLGAAFKEGERWAPNPINKRLREVLTPEEYEAAVMSRNSAYYTPAPVIDAMWDIAKALGFKGGRIVEGSAGIGNILGLMPTDISERSDIHAVEIDNMTGGILSLLYPDAKVEVQGFEQTRIPNGSVDLAITNVPFVTGLHVMDESGDIDLSKKFRDIHDFCIAKNVRKLREGGIGIFISSSGTLDRSQKLRNWLVGDKEGNADVVGVFRMHNQTFGGTGATSDIIVVRKRVNGKRSANAIDVSTAIAARTAAFTDGNKTKDLPLIINRHFVEHPEHMAGEMYFGFEQGDTYRPTSMGLFPVRGVEQAERMDAWVKELAEKDWKSEAPTRTIEEGNHINEALGEGVKEGSMVLDSEGNLCTARMGRAVPISVNKNKIKGRSKEECFKDYSTLKEALDAVLKYQTEHDDDAGLKPLLDKLNKAYDTFVQRYGNLNKNTQLAWLRNNDIDFPSIAALETVSERATKEGKKEVTYGKTDIFSSRVVEKESEPAPKNVKDGIIASIYKFGRIDTEYLAEQLGKSREDITREIVESGLGFVEPTTGQVEVSYEYLSGNVREKLRQAREAEAAAPGEYAANIKVLEAVVPMNIPAHLIEFTLGSSWIDPKLYEDYVKEKTEVEVKLTNVGGTWHMKEPYYTERPKNTEMGIRSEELGILIPGHKLIEAAITNKTITVSKTKRNWDGSTETIVDQAATAACGAKVDEIRQDFKDWARDKMQTNPEMSMRMEEIYNEKFNNSVPKSIPDEFVPEHFGGAATTVGGRPFKLRPHQAKAVIRATTQPVLLAHEVGTGKTYTLITTAMEMRRLGTARKPMIVVQNATVGQFVASAKALYPNAKVLTLEDVDRTSEGRRAFYAKIKFNDWDMIVVPQSVFERIPDSAERQTKFIQEKIEEKLLVLEQMKEADPDGKSIIVRQAEKEISKLEDEIAQLASGGMVEDTKSAKKKEKDAKKAAVTRQNAEVKARELLDRATDDVEDFDSMGIDAILVDEAHEYKHLGFATAMQRGVKGVDPTPSKKSQGVFLKVQSVLEKTGGKNVVFATGTPISNTAAEIWTFMRYLMPADVMKDYGIYYFDDFVRNFGNLQQMLEFTTSGKYKENNRFAGYVNLPELVRIWSTVADTVLTREAGGVSDKIPDMEGGKAQDVFLPQTRALRSIMKFVKAQLDAYDKMSGKEKKENSHIPLVMYGIAKAAAVDARLVQADAADDPNSKTNETVRQTLRSLKETEEYKGVVSIFADNYQNKASGFNLYEDIRKKLIAAGVPEEQIVVMKSGMSVKKKLDIFNRANAGEVRVIMGSTFTLGTGVNIQERHHTLIHVDAPNRPMDYTQRNGRILRQGNMHRDWNLPVRVLRFGVEDSLDVTAYQRLKTKGAIADSIMNGKSLMSNSMENRTLEEEQDLYGDMTAQLSGSEWAMKKNQVEKEVRKLQSKQKQWAVDQTYIHNRKRQIAGQNKEAEQRIADNKGYLEKVEKAEVGNITVGRLTFPSMDAMEDFFKEQNKKKLELQEQVRNSGYTTRATKSELTISIGGFDFKIETEIKYETKQGDGGLFASAPAKMTYSCPELGIDKMPVEGNLVKNAVKTIMEDVLSGKDFSERIEYAQRSIDRNNEELKSFEARDGVPFKEAEALAKAEATLEEYEENMKKELEEKEAKYADMDKDVDEAQGIEYSGEDEGEESASEPIAEYSGESSKFASRYETEDGKEINYTSENPENYGGLFDFDFTAENARGTEVGSRARANEVRLEDNPDRTEPGSGLNKANGEFALVERIFKETGSFSFTGAERIESADDVAFIFSALEDAAKEHTFAVYVKDGKPTVVELGMGSFNASIADTPTASLAYSRIKPDEVYFVHNHPSGNLKYSPQDAQLLKKMQEMCDVPVYGVIINLKTGKYGTFDSTGRSAEGNKRVPANEHPLTIHSLDKQIFAPNYDPQAQPLVRGSSDVAAFLNSHRMGDRAKVSFLILSQSGHIVGNIHTPFTEMRTDVRNKARYISEKTIQFGGAAAILYGDFDINGVPAHRYSGLRDQIRQVGDIRLLDVVRVEGNHTISANDEGILNEPDFEYGNSDLRFREVDDDKVMGEFADGKTVKAYRTMQVIDGELYSPMAAKVGGKSTPSIKLGKPEMSEEHPEIIKKTKPGKDGMEQGYVVIDKGQGKGTLEVAYNPYIHASRTVLNDQLTSQHIRPNLVTVEVEIPESELSSGYRAEKAKDAVGEISWHSGTVSGQLAALGNPRRVILSRYDKPVRIVPYKEVARMIAEQLDGTDIEIPFNTVTPQVRAELEKLGVVVSDKASGTATDVADYGKAEYITDQEIERINAKHAEMAQTSAEAKRGHVEGMSRKLNTPVRIVENPEELTHGNAEMQRRMRASKGFYDPRTGEVVIVLPNNDSVEDVAETMLHETVAHKGLRELVGEENYDAFCDEVYDHLKEDLKEEVDQDATRRFVNDPGKGYESARREAVDELFGRLGEKDFEDFTKAERGIWAKLKQKVLDAINKFLGALKLPKWVKLGDNELRYMLWKSHERLRTKGDYVERARDAAKREELGLTGNVRFRDGETGDIWKDRSVGLEERITNAAIRLSNNQSGDLTLRNDAMRAIGGNLTSLRRAMALQRTFDQTTVKRVADLARILMQNGYLSGMTSGEMQRLLSAVKNSVGHQEVKESVQKVMDIMVQNQLRNGEATLRSLLSIKGSKVDARGVEVQGALDVEGQRMMEVVKKAMPLKEDDINDRIAEALNRMSDPDNTIADQAAIEYAGLNMALEYVQNIAESKAEEKALRDSIKTAKEDKDAGRMTADAYKQLVETTEDAIRKNKIERAEAYFNLVGRLSDSLRGSIENAKAFREAEKTRVQEIHHNANSDMEGRATNEHHRDGKIDKLMNNGIVQFLFAPLGTFDQILRVFGNKSASGEGYLWNRFMRGWVDCRNKELQGVKDKFAILDEKAAEIFGKGTTWGKVIRMEGRLPKAAVSFWDGGEMRDHELTQGNLMYIYMVDKMSDGRMKLRRMGITEDDVTAVENMLDPRLKKLADWLQEEFLVDTRNEYNETHKRMFGASMAAIENYFPLKILANARIDKEEDVNQQNRPDGITTKTGSIIKRRVNNLALDITGADALSVILDHITQMEHWNAYAEWNRDLNTLRTYKRFRNQVMNMTTVYGGGRKLWENFNNLCLMAAGEYRPPVADLDKSAVNIAKGVTAAKVSFRVFTALKQLLSAPAYAPEVSMRSIAKSIVNPYGDFKWCLENMPIFRERWHSRISGDPRLLKSDMDWKMWRSRVMQISSRIGMTPNAFVDAVTVAIGARAMYDTRLRQYLKEGYPTDMAEQRAKQDATILFNQTQQSSEAPFLATMQVDRSWLSTMFTIFRNASISYSRQQYDAMRNLKRNLTPGQRDKSVAFMAKQILRDWDVDPDTATDDEKARAESAAKKRFRRQMKKDIIRVATFGFILQLLWNLGPYMPYLIFGNDDDDKEKMWDDAMTHAYFGSVEGLTCGDVMSSFGNMAASGEWSFNQLTKDMPVTADINNIINKFIGGKNAEAFTDIFNLLVQTGIGMNPQSISDTAVAIMDACGDDPALSHETAIFVMRVLQVPQSQLDKMYFDEIGLSGEEASKLTPKELAERYATYKVKRGTPYTPWAWGDEERLGKYQKVAEDRMKEHLDTQGDKQLLEAYADFEERYKAVDAKAKDARALMKTDYMAAAQAHAALQADPDFRMYQQFGALDKQLTRISKLYFDAQSPEEAVLIRDAIVGYREGMVRVLQAETAEAQQTQMGELTKLLTEFSQKYQQLHPAPQMQTNR